MEPPCGTVVKRDGLLVSESGEEKMQIRRFCPDDAAETSRMIAAALWETNRPDYPIEEIEDLTEFYSPAGVLRRAEESHMYVGCENGVVVGCGAISGYNGSETESYIMTLFVLPACQGKGVGRQLLETLEKDEIFLRAERVELGSSITAHRFYKKMGYTYMDGGSGEPDAEGTVHMEKRRRHRGA